MLESVHWKSGSPIYFCPICYAALNNRPCPVHGFKTRFAGHFRSRKLDDKMKTRVRDVLTLAERVSKDFGGVTKWIVINNGPDAGAERYCYHMRLILGLSYAFRCYVERL